MLMSATSLGASDIGVFEDVFIREGIKAPYAGFLSPRDTYQYYQTRTDLSYRFEEKIRDLETAPPFNIEANGLGLVIGVAVGFGLAMILVNNH